MTVYNPSWKLTVNGVNYTNLTIANLSHSAGRKDIYNQPSSSYISCTIISLNGSSYSFNVNDGITLQIKDTTGAYVTLFGGNITDLTVQVGNTGSVGTEIQYQITALGTMAKLQKAVTNGILSQALDGAQIVQLLQDLLLNSWNEVAATTQWNGYTATTTWAYAENVGYGEIDAGLYTLENRASKSDTYYNIAAQIANSAFGYLYEDKNGFICYADANHRQNYLATYGYVNLNANDAIGKGLKATTRTGDIRNQIYLNYGNNYGSQKTATDTVSIALYGYRAESINSLIHSGTDAQEVADRYINQRSSPSAQFESITFPITSPELSDATRNALLGVFIGMPIYINNLPIQIRGGEFEGYVEGWSWSVSYNQLYLTLNLSPIGYSQTNMRWNTTPATEAWNTLSAILTWTNATIVA